MIEEYLFNYGVLGLWTASLIYERVTFQRRIVAVLEKVEKKL